MIIAQAMKSRMSVPNFVFKATARGALLLERSSLDRGNAVGKIFWYFHFAIVSKNEKPRSKDLNKFANFRGGA
jgi:hypothetical protein